MAYSINDVAQMLQTNPETVRRWCRTGKINADKASRKTGFTVTQEALDNFLEKHPKYEVKVYTKTVFNKEDFIDKEYEEYRYDCIQINELLKTKTNLVKVYKNQQIIYQGMFDEFEDKYGIFIDYRHTDVFFRTHLIYDIVDYDIEAGMTLSSELRIDTVRNYDIMIGGHNLNEFIRYKYYTRFPTKLVNTFKKYEGHDFKIHITWNDNTKREFSGKLIEVSSVNLKFRNGDRYDFHLDPDSDIPRAKQITVELK